MVQLTVPLYFSIQEWELEEWNEQHAKFTFLKETVELLVLFGPENASKSIEGMHTELMKTEVRWIPDTTK